MNVVRAVAEIAGEFASGLVVGMFVLAAALGVAGVLLGLLTWAAL